MSIRTIYLKMTIDWEDYEDVGDDLIIEDSGILDFLKDGVIIEQICAPKDEILPEKENIVKDEKVLEDDCKGLPSGFKFNKAGRVVLDPRYIPNIED